jgi:hypothetical protein
MSNFRNIEELRIEIQRLRGLKEVQKSLVKDDLDTINSFLSPLLNIGSLIKTIVLRKIGNSLWFDIISFLIKEIKDRQIFSSGFSGIIDLFKGFFRRSSN